jgi:hypothetical protein
MTLKQLYEALEDDNEHGLCAVLVAVAAGEHDAAIRCAEILKIHRTTGLTGELSQERYSLSQPCYDRLRDIGRI